MKEASPMKNNEYRAFKKAVALADAKNEIWWAGYYWISLTHSQCKDMIDLLETKPFIKHSKTMTNMDALQMPSGLMIHY